VTEIVDREGPEPATAGRRWVGPCAEVAVSFATAGLFMLWSRNTDVDPLDRLGQIAGISAMAFRYTVISGLLVAAVVIAARVRAGIAFDMTSRLVCAAVAGLVSGMVAGGIVIALRGTPWGLNGNEGDAGDLIKWALDVRAGNHPPYAYPPLGLHVLDRYARVRDIEVAFALKHLQILGTAALGPAAYLSWRLLLRPGWALGVGMIAALPLIDVAPYKPYTSLVLIVFVPAAIRMLEMIRHADQVSIPQSARRGVLMGAGFGLLCLLYSGWFKWSAPGLLFAVLVVFPWRSRVGTRKALVFGAVAFATFALLAGGHVRDALTENFSDSYKYFDVGVEPAYIAMYRNDLPGTLFSWPPLGELGGVGVFSIILYAGFGAAVVLGRSRTLVIGVGAIMTGCWLLRFYYAQDLYATGRVQLYPRTTAEILYCLLIFCCYAVYLAMERASRRGAPESLLRSPSGLIGAVCGLLLLLGSAASSISDHYMPSSTKPPGPGWLTWTAHQMPH